MTRPLLNEGEGYKVTLSTGGQEQVSVIAVQSDITRERLILRHRVSGEYDQKIIGGFYLDVALPDAGQVQIYFDREDLDNINGIITLAMADGAAATDVVAPAYLFENGLKALTLQDCVTVGAAFVAEKSEQFGAHLAVKTAIDLGVMPAQADYETIGLVASDFDGLGLT